MSIAKADRLQRGDRVLTETTSGELILCYYLAPEEGEHLLESPSHGYVIRRHAYELKEYRS